MATVTGTLTDFGLAPLAAFSPQLIFTADQPAVTPGGVLTTRPITVTPTSDGSFTVDLVMSINTSPETTYSLRIEWLDSAGGYIGMDVLSGLVVPPTATSSISDLTSIPVSRWWVSAPEPNNPDMPIGLADPGLNTWWLDTDTGDLKEWV